MSKKIELNDEILDKINGGAIGFNPDGQGTYTMKCQFSGETFGGVTLQQIIQIAQFCATIPNTAEGEQQIIDWARGKGIIS